MKKIRVLVVDDSLLFRKTIVDGISKHPQIEVVAMASNPYEARDCIIQYKPDVMTLDVEMPRMDGISFLSKLMPQYPMPVIMVSAVDDRVFEAMENGAVDFVVKSKLASNDHLNTFIRELSDKIVVASKANIVRKELPEPTHTLSHKSRKNGTIKLIALGASTGGIEATEKILTKLPITIPPMIIVQHMPAEFTRMYAERLNRICAPTIKEAENGDKLESGTIYIAKGGFHMKLVRSNDLYFLKLFQGDKVNGHIPSVDVTFQSVANYFNSDCISIILTGMGLDGAKGIRLLHNQGSPTIGQDEASSVVYGMPKAAFDYGAVDYQLSIHDIAGKIIHLLNRQ